MTNYFLSTLACIILGIAAPSASAADTPLLAEGAYVTAGPSHYLDGAVEFSSWAEDMVMDATLVRDGRTYAVQANLTFSQGHRYDGNGLITVAYDNGRVCQHRFGIIVFAYEDRIFLRENMPRSIPFNPNGACGAAGPYIWTDHEEPYLAAES